MKPKSFKSDFHIARPFVALGRTFAVIGLLFCIATPFTDGIPSRWTFLFAGLGYSAFLAFLSTGVLLLPQPQRRRVFTAVLVFWAFAVLVLAALLAALHFRVPLSFIRYSTPPLLGVSCAFIAATLAFACYGWYHRLAHAAPNVA